MKKISETPKVKGQSVLIWGASGSGKTVFMGSAGLRTLFISNARKHEVLKSKWFKEKYNSDPYIIEIPLDSIPSNAQTSPSLDDSFKKIEDAIEQGLKSDEVDVIALDDSTAFTLSSTLRSIKYNSGGLTKTLAKTAKYDIIIPELGDYRVEKEYTKQFLAWVISECKDRGKHFILGAHERCTFDPPTKIGGEPIPRKIVPAFTGADKNPDFIPGLFDWVFHLESTENMKEGKLLKKYFAVTEGDENLLARSSFSGVLPDKWENPNFLEMLKLIEEKG